MRHRWGLRTRLLRVAVILGAVISLDDLRRGVGANPIQREA